MSDEAKADTSAGDDAAGEGSAVEEFYEWVDRHRDRPGVPLGEGMKGYFHGVAEARYVIRKVFRIVDDQAKAVEMEPLELQAMIQIFGAPRPPRVSDLAERLDIAPAFASRLVRTLVEKGLAERTASSTDRRSTFVDVTPKGEEMLAVAVAGVEEHVGYFQRQLSDAQRAAALGIFAFYLGATPRLEDIEGLVELVRSERGRGR